MLQQQFLGHLDGSQIFGNDMSTAAEHDFAHAAPGGFDLLHGDVAKGLDLRVIALEDRYAFLALLAAAGVFAVAEDVLDHGVGDHDA